MERWHTRFPHLWARRPVTSLCSVLGRTALWLETSHVRVKPRRPFARHRHPNGYGPPTSIGFWITRRLTGTTNVRRLHPPTSLRGCRQAKPSKVQFQMPMADVDVVHISIIMENRPLFMLQPLNWSWPH
ncbi:hypothetical protein BHM03_00036745 [Ensete ventricosum]|nr:hypothetical protein BHM03_00036745 [Ensete ventricosum]